MFLAIMGIVWSVSQPGSGFHPSLYKGGLWVGVGREEVEAVKLTQKDLLKFRRKATLDRKRLGVKFTQLRLYTTHRPDLKMLVWVDHAGNFYRYDTLEPWNPGLKNCVESVVELE